MSTRSATRWERVEFRTLLREPLRNGHSAKASTTGKGIRTLTLTAVTNGDFSEKNTKLTVATREKADGLWLEPGDVLIERSNTPQLVGTAAVYRGPGNFAIFPDLVIRARMVPSVSDKYIGLFLASDSARTHFQRAAQGIAGSMPKISQDVIERLQVPLPPREVQDRIVAEIEKQFTRLDAGVAALKRLQAHLRRYRAAVLKAACCGRAVGKGSKAADQSRQEGWGTITLGELSSLVTSGSRGWGSLYVEEGPIFIRAQDIKTDRLDLSAVAHVRLPKGTTEGARTRVRRDDLLITITGANVTKSARVNAAIDEGYVSQHVGLVRLKDPAWAAYMHHWLVSPADGRRHLLKAAYGAGKPGLNLENLRSLPVALPPLSIRDEVVAWIEANLSRIDAVEATIEAQVVRASRLRSATLRAAFDGRLSSAPGGES